MSCLPDAGRRIKTFDVQLIFEAMTLDEPAFGDHGAGVAFANVELPNDARSFGGPVRGECRAGIHRVTSRSEQVRPVGGKKIAEGQSEQEEGASGHSRGRTGGGA